MEKDLLSRNFTPLKYGSWQSAVGKEVFVNPKRVTRKRSGGVFCLGVSSDLRKGTPVIKFI